MRSAAAVPRSGRAGPGQTHGGRETPGYGLRSRLDGPGTQLFTARFGRLRTRPFPLVQRPPVARRTRRHRLRGRPNPIVAFGQRQVCTEILVANRHALDGSAWPEPLPVPRRIALEGQNQHRPFNHPAAEQLPPGMVICHWRFPKLGNDTGYVIISQPTDIKPVRIRAHVRGEVVPVRPVIPYITYVKTAIYHGSAHPRA